MNAPYMPLFVADYLADTAHLSAAEHGAYLLLLMNYWQRQKPLPADDRKLARIARMSDAEWGDARETLAELFRESDGLWHHKRVDAELVRLGELAAKAAAAGRASGEARRAKADTNANIIERPLNDRSTNDEPSGKARLGKVEPRIDSTQPVSRARALLEPVSVDQSQEPIRTRIAVAEAFNRAGQLPPDTSRVAVWLQQGYTPAEIEAVIGESLSRGRKPGSLSYFDKALAEIRTMPVATGPPVQRRSKGGGLEALDQFIEMQEVENARDRSNIEVHPAIAQRMAAAGR
jgi:uncharacterized protein YdaU (DUF1376 family)